MASALDDNGGVYFVPAFVGLGAPHWEPEARGTVFGLTRGSTRDHLVRAALEAMAYATQEVLGAMVADSSVRTTELRVDGGAALNDWLMTFQAGVLDVPVRRPALVEVLAGLQEGERVVAEGTQRARPGEVVEIVREIEIAADGVLGELAADGRRGPDENPL